MGSELLGEVGPKRLRCLLLANVAFVDRLARMQISGKDVFPEIFQVVARVSAMAALVRLGACVQAHVPLQMRGEFRFESAAGIGTSTQLRFHGGRGILVSSPMPT